MASLAALDRPEHPGLRWTPSSQWHVTLRFFGRIDVDEGVTAGQATAAVARRTPPAVAELGPAVGSLGRKVLQVPVAGLEAVARALVATSAEIGQRPSPRPFSGHVTLARNRGRSLEGVVGEEVSGRWTVEEISLVASVSSNQNGVPNRYETVATFPLEG